MANIKSINGNPIVVETDNIADKAVTRRKIAIDDVGPLGIITLTPELLNSSAWENGNLTSGNNSNYREQVRARSTTKWLLTDDLNIGRKKEYADAVVLCSFYDSNGTFVSTQNWSQEKLIPKGSVVRIVITPSNTMALLDMTPEEILQCFEITYPFNMVGSYDPDDCVIALLGGSGQAEYRYDSRIMPKGIIETNRGIVGVTCPSGWKMYLKGYDENKAYKENIVESWLTGTQWFDAHDYPYFKPMLAKSDDSTIELTSMPDGTKVYVQKELERPADRGQLLSIAKDGINNSVNGSLPKFPSSSIASFEAAYKQGFSYLLIHVQFTSDNVPVMMHDVYINNVARNDDGSQISGTVRIADHTYAELLAYDFGILYGQRFAGTRVAKLEEGLAFAKAHGMGVIIEPTVTLSPVSRVETVCRMIKAYGLHRRCGYFSFYTSTFGYVTPLLPEASLLYKPADATAEDSRIISHMEDFVANKTGKNRLFLYTSRETDLTQEVVESLLENEVEVCLQRLPSEGIEPATTVDGITNHPEVTAVVSQVMPADFAMSN